MVGTAKWSILTTAIFMASTISQAALRGEAHEAAVHDGIRPELAHELPGEADGDVDLHDQVVLGDASTRAYATAYATTRMPPHTRPRVCHRIRQAILLGAEPRMQPHAHP